MRVKLADCIELLDSKRIPLSGKEREKFKKIYPYYGAQGIIDYVDGYIFNGNYILVAEDGNNLKTLKDPVAAWATGKFWVNNHAHILGACHCCNLRYIFYLLNFIDISKYVTGSAQPKLNQENLLNIEIDLPDRKTQDKIAEILSGIDEQINRNNEVVKKLQVLAQTTYSRWFNQFEFPNEDGLPYKSSGGKMVWSDELKREIPDDWKVVALGDLLLKNTEKINNTNGVNTIDLSVMPSDNFVLNELNKSDNFTTNLFKMHRGDLMFGSIRPYLHKAGIAPCDGAFAGTVHSFCARNNNDYNLCLCALTSKDMFSFAVKKSKGTKMPVISSSDLLSYKISYSEQISKQFTELLDIRDIVCNCVMQNNILKSIKCKLLPLLINGQINP